MAEQPFVQIPNTTTAGVAGSPTNAQVVADDTSQSGIGPFIQQFSPATALRNAISVIASVFQMAVDMASGRLRVTIEAVGTSVQSGGTLSVSAQATTFTASVVFGASASPRPDNLAFDVMMDSWANNTNPCIARS